MPAPLGNQYAVGNPNSGRPSEHNVEEMAKKLLLWAKKEEAWILREFAPLNGFSCTTMHRWVTENEVFRNAYEQAKDIIGCRREKMYLKERSESTYKRYAAYYDSDLFKFEELIKEKDAKRSKDAEGNKVTNYNIMVPNDLAVGANLQATPISNQIDPGSK